MRITKYIAALAVLLCSVGCTMNELDELSGNINGAGSDSAVRVFGYISHYDGCTVSSRADGGAAKDPTVGETKVSNMGFAVFKMNGTEGNYSVGDLIYYDYQSSSNITFVLEREGAMVDDDNDGVEDTEVKYDRDALYAMYVFTNMPNMPKSWSEAKGKTLSEFKKEFYSPAKADYDKAVGLGIPSMGFPMMGSMGDCSAEGDGHKLVLVRYDGQNMDVPTVDGAPKDLLEVPMDVLYAKMRFTIKVDPDQSIVGMNTPKFTMENYTIHNIPKKVHLDVNDNKSTAADTYTVASWNGAEGLKVDMASSADGSQTGVISFDFYLPEQLVTPKILSTAYNYPFVGAEGGKPSASDPRIREEDEGLRQRYKPELIGDSQNAPYITINGVFQDHQSHSWDVSYKIYLGGDNYGNFEVKRNTLYENIVTIRGIHNSNDMSDNGEAVSIDHRVNIKRTQPFIIGLRRECSLDAHFEVRPLRIRKNGSFSETIPTNAAVKVSVSYLDDNRQPVNLAKANRWVGLERSYGNGANTTSATYIHKDATYPSNGKRKYFTTDLTTVTLSNDNAASRDGKGFSASGAQTVIVPMPNAVGEAESVWIYIDECTEASTDIEAQRFARVAVEYGTVATDGTFTTDPNLAPVIYTLAQHKLYEVVTTRDEYEEGVSTFPKEGIYHIEHEEEYLYNFDSEDTFDHAPTFDDGMTWGLDSVQLSKNYPSFDCEETNGQWTTYANSKPHTFDFYIGKHDSFAGDTGGTVRNYAGWDFTKEIYENSNGEVNGVKVRTMAEQPEGAVEYCYNRNKRNEDGSIAEINWYLPSVDQLEDFIVAAYGSFKEFQDNYYWASQPAYIRNVFYYEYNETTEIFGAVISKRRRDTYPFVVYDDNPHYARATKVVVGSDGEFDYALSGLNEVPDPDHYVDYTSGTEMINYGYYYKMYKWKRERSGTVSPTETLGNPDYNGGEEFDEYRDGSLQYKDGSNIKKRYHIHLGHLEYMKQEGYHERTRSNRVRCIRKVN